MVRLGQRWTEYKFEQAMGNLLRVAFSGYVFARQGDRTYVAITLIVLTTLLYSLFQR